MKEETKVALKLGAIIAARVIFMMLQYVFHYMVAILAVFWGMCEGARRGSRK